MGAGQSIDPLRGDAGNCENRELQRKSPALGRDLYLYSCKTAWPSLLVIHGLATVKTLSTRVTNMYNTALLLLCTARLGSAFPWVANLDGVDGSLLRRQDAGSAANCPFNPNHKPAAPVTDAYPYNNARNGLPGNGKGGYKVPADGDTAHYFVAPGANDIRGPCPGLNTAANHNFLAHDGIVTFNELVDAQQNVYNVGYDLAVLLAVLGISGDGDVLSQKLSIGCDATSRTALLPLLSQKEPGLAGHNKFESDTSLTRNDYFTHGGDDFTFNATLFSMMTDVTGGDYNLENLAQYRYERYQQSLQENSNFYFGPFSLLLYGAASFLYELFPSGTRDYAPDVETISSFFGAEKDSNGNWQFNNQEKIPDNWTNREDPYDTVKVVAEIAKMYLLHPVLFGGNTGDGTFDVIEFGSIKNGSFPDIDAKSISCLIYQLATERVPSSLNGILIPTVDALTFALNKLTPGFDNLGCPFPLTS